MLYLIGLGLGDAKDITVKGLEVVRRCSRVYLEAYTSVLTVGKEVLEEFYGRKLILADREEVEQEADNILKDADISDVAFLVVGDPFGATTHSDLILRATKLGISYRVIHNASIMSAVGCCGLQFTGKSLDCETQRTVLVFFEALTSKWCNYLHNVPNFIEEVCTTAMGMVTVYKSVLENSAYLYKFGETVSIVFWTDTWRPESFFDKVKKNRQNGMHTLCLLDIKVKEQSLENLIKGRKIYEPPRYMSVNQAARQLLEVVQNHRARGEEPAVTEETLCVGLARVGAEDQKIAAGTLQQMCAVDLGGPLHSLIITGGSMHPLEMEMLSLFSVPETSSESQSIDGL